MVKACFFDRDGVLNHLAHHKNMMTAPWSIDEFKLIRGAKKAVETVKKLNYITCVVSNQPDLYDGYLAKTDLKLMTKKISKLGIHHLRYAFKRNSAYYKPNNGMLETVINRYNIDRSNSYMVGDSWKDIVAGYQSGVKTIYIGKVYSCPENYNHIQPDFIVKSVIDASKIIMENDDD